MPRRVQRRRTRDDGHKDVNAGGAINTCRSNLYRTRLTSLDRGVAASASRVAVHSCCWCARDGCSSFTPNSSRRKVAKMREQRKHVGAPFPPYRDNPFQTFPFGVVCVEFATCMHGKEEAATSCSFSFFACGPTPNQTQQQNTTSVHITEHQQSSTPDTLSTLP